MATQWIGELIEILEEEMRLYREVLTLLGEERSALVSRRPDSVLALVRHKETQLLRIRTLDESRQILCRRLARLWGLDPGTLTLKAIAQRATAPQDAQVRDLRERLATCMALLREANESNSRICQQGIETVQTILQSVTKQNDENGMQGYGPRLAARHGTESGGILYRRT